MNVLCKTLGAGTKACLYAAVFIAPALVLPVVAADPDELALVALWRNHERLSIVPANHAEVVAQCAQYGKYFPGSSYLPVAHGLAAWHMLAAGQRKDAVAVFDQMISSSTDPVAMAGNQMALRWMTRLDREVVVAALLGYFGDHVVYPESIHVFDNVPLVTRPPLVDRWGRAWKYRLAAFKHLKRAKKQRYILESSELDPLTDLKDALNVPYASRINIKPVSIMAAVPGLNSVMFETTNANPVRAVMGENGLFQRRITFVRLTSSFVLLTDGDHWLLTARPAR